MIIRFIMAVCAASVAAGCASKSSEVAPTYISPMIYQNYNCQQLAQEAQSVSTRAAQIAGVQDQKSTNDAVVTGVAIVVFWPAAFFVKGDGATAAELGNLRGHMNAIEQASIQKKCNIQFNRPAAPTPE